VIILVAFILVAGFAVLTFAR
jgi:hypothetical protein